MPNSFLPLVKLRCVLLCFPPCIAFVYLYFAIMKPSTLATIGVLAGVALAQNATSTSSSPLTEYTLQAENITAVMLPYGARLVSLLVPDRNGEMQDVVLGYDNASQYPVDTATNHTYFGKTNSRPHIEQKLNLD